MPTLTRFARFVVAGLSFLAAGLSMMRAQGGPPMITDDPGTPGPGKWEINLGWTIQRVPGETLCGLPQLDANYGIGDRIEIAYEVSYLQLKEAGEPRRWGVSQSELGVKWRFYDTGEKGIQVAVCPQVCFLTPGSHSDRRGLTDEGNSWQLPLEIEKDLEIVSVGVDIGHVFAQGGEEDAWFGGVCVGREIVKGWELDAEIHCTADKGLADCEWLVNAGTRIDLSEHATLMLAIGRDLGNQLDPKISLVTYAGIQLRF